MPNTVKITVLDPDDLLDAGMYGPDGVIHTQTCATSDGAYADPTGTGSTPTVALVSGVSAFKAYDPNGTSTSWYRCRYENVGATRTSDWTDPFTTRPL